MLSKNIRYLVGVDHLRGFAALLVILYHGTQLLGANIAHHSIFVPSIDWGFTNWNILKSFISEGHFGVALFMTLSGFIFTTGLYKKHMNVKGFFRNRFVRIYPLYIFLIFLSLYLHAPGDPLKAIVLAVLPFANIHEAYLGISGLAVSAMFWTIAVEVQFYLAFPFLIRWLNEHKFKLLWGIIGLFTVLRLLAYLSGDIPMSNFGYFTIFGRIDQFILGMFAGYVYLNRSALITKKAKIMTLGSFIGIALLLFIMNRLRHHMGYVLFNDLYVILPTIEGAFAAALIVSYVAFAQTFKHRLSRWFARIGELSYSLYLTHFMILNLLVHRVPFPNVLHNNWYSALLFTTILVIPLAIGLSWLTYNTIEKPFLDMRKKYTFAKKDTQKTQQAI